MTQPDTHFEIAIDVPPSEDDTKRFMAWLFEMADNAPPAVPAEAIQKRIDELREEAQDGNTDTD